MQSTHATVIIPIDLVEEAQKDLPGHFTAQYGETSEGPATHAISSGFFYNYELEMISNQLLWSRVVKFGDLDTILRELNLTLVIPKDDINI